GSRFDLERARAAFAEIEQPDTTWRPRRRRPTPTTTSHVLRSDHGRLHESSRTTPQAPPRSEGSGDPPSDRKRRAHRRQSQPVQWPGSSPSAYTNSIPGSAHSAAEVAAFPARVDRAHEVEVRSSYVKHLTEFAAVSGHGPQCAKITP